jgi:hypothetical protein
MCHLLRALFGVNRSMESDSRFFARGWWLPVASVFALVLSLGLLGVSGYRWYDVHTQAAHANERLVEVQSWSARIDRRLISARMARRQLRASLKHARLTRHEQIQHRRDLVSASYRRGEVAGASTGSAAGSREGERNGAKGADSISTSGWYAIRIGSSNGVPRIEDSYSLVPDSSIAYSIEGGKVYKRSP